MTMRAHSQWEYTLYSTARSLFQGSQTLTP